MGMPLLQSVTSVLRQTWGFDLVPLRHLVDHLVDHWVDTILIVISRVGLSARHQSLLFGHPLARVAELLHHFCGTPLVSGAPELSCSASPQEKEKRPAWAGRGYQRRTQRSLFACESTEPARLNTIWLWPDSPRILLASSSIRALVCLVVEA